MKIFLKILLILLLLNILGLIYMACPSPRRMLKDNTGIEVSIAKFKENVLKEDTSDACLYYIFELSSKENEKIQNQLTEITKENIEFIETKMIDYKNRICSDAEEKYLKKFDSDIIKVNNYFKYELGNHRLNLSIYIPSKDELHYFSVYVLN